MNQLTTTVTQKGQVTIPVSFRKKYKMPSNSRVVVSEGDGFLKIRPVLSIKQLAGCLKRPGQKPMSIKELRDFRAKGVMFDQS